jgi:hypothetical protein
MKKHELLGWTSANALGFAIAFLAILETKMLIDYGFNWEMHWNWVEKPVNQERMPYISALIGLLLAGVIFGSAQTLVVRSRNVRVFRWILATVAGFGALAVAVEWPLIAFGLLGIMPGPAEPIIFTVGGGILAGICQYLSLRSDGIFAGNWLALLIAGLIVSLMPTALFFMLIEGPLGIEMSWPLGIFFSGFIVAGVAALISGRALFAVLSALPETASHP